MTPETTDVPTSLREWAANVRRSPDTEAAVELLIRYGLAKPRYPWVVCGDHAAMWIGYWVDFAELARVAIVTPGQDSTVMTIAANIGRGIPVLLTGENAELDPGRAAFVHAALRRAPAHQWPPDRTTPPAVPEVVIASELQRRRQWLREFLDTDQP